MFPYDSRLNYYAREFLLFFYNPHDNTVRMVNEYLNKSAMLFGSIDRWGTVNVSGPKLCYMTLLAFFSLLEIVKEFLFISHLVGYDSVMRYVFIDCSMLFPSMRYFYVIMHATLSLPFCGIFLYFWYLNANYYFAMKNRVAEFRQLNGTTTSQPDLLTREIVKTFNFRFLAFLMYGQTDKVCCSRVAADYAVRRKYLDVMFRITNLFQSFFYPV